MLKFGFVLLKELPRVDILKESIEPAIELSTTEDLLMSSTNNWLPLPPPTTPNVAKSTEDERKIPVDNLRTYNRNICCPPTSLSISVYVSVCVIRSYDCS